MAYNNLYRGLRRGPAGRGGLRGVGPGGRVRERTYQPIVPEYQDPNFDVRNPDDETLGHDLNPQVVDHRMRLLNQKKKAQELLSIIPPEMRGERAYYQSQIASADQFLDRSSKEGQANNIVDRYRKLKGDIEGKYQSLIGEQNDPLAPYKTSTISGDAQGYGVLPGETILEYRRRMEKGNVPGPISPSGGNTSKIEQDPYDPREIVIPPIPDDAYPPITPAPIGGGIKGGGGPLKPIPPKPGSPLQPPVKVPVPPKTPVGPKAPIKPQPVPAPSGKPMLPGPSNRPGPLDPRPPGPGYEPPKPGFKPKPIPIPKVKPPSGPPRPGPLDPRPSPYPPEPVPPNRVPEPIPPMPKPKPPRPIPPRPPIAPAEPAPPFPKPTPGIKGVPGPRGPGGPTGPIGPTGPGGPKIPTVKVPPGRIPGGPTAGPTGPTGPTGPVGPGGPTGPLGPAGLGIGSIPPGGGEDYLKKLQADADAAKANGDFNKAADIATAIDNYMKGLGGYNIDPNKIPLKPEPNMTPGQPAPPYEPEPEPEPAPVGAQPGAPAPPPPPLEPPPLADLQPRFTPRDILSQRPPRPDLHDPSMMGTDSSKFKYGNLPDMYKREEAPTLTPRQQIEDIGRYKEPLPNQKPIDEAPGKWQPEPVQRFDRYGQPLPEGYGYSEAPEFTAPDIVDTATRYGEPVPDVYGERELPPIERGEKIEAPTQYGEERPDIYDIENAPEVTARSTDFEKYQTPDSVGRMGAVERFDKFSELNKAEIERPPELGKPGPQGGVDFTDLMKWKNTTGNEKYVPREFVNDPHAAWRAGMGDFGNVLMGGKFEGRAEQALQNEVKRQKEYQDTEDTRKQAVHARNIATQDMGIKEQTLKANIANMASQQNVSLRQQDLNYLVEGARLGTDVYKTRVGERLGLGRLALEGDRLQMDALKQYTDASQDAQKTDINAKNVDISNQREKTRLANETVKDVAQIQEQQDRMMFDRWAKKSGLTGEKYRDELARYKAGYEGHKDFTQFKMEQQRLNAAQEADFQKTRLAGYSAEGVVQSERYKNLLAKYNAGYATEKDYQDMKSEQAKFNALAKTKFQENNLKRWESNLAGKSQTFKDALDKYKTGYATEKDYRELTLEQDKFDTLMKGKVSDQEIDKWKNKEVFKDNQYGRELDKWKAGQKNEFDFLAEKRLRTGLNMDETHRFDQMKMDRWKLGQEFTAEQFKNNLLKWDRGQKDLQFATEEERARFDSNNAALYRADSNALTKYGHDREMWKDYNTLPSTIRNNEAQADWYMEQARKSKQGKTKEEDPLEWAKHVDGFNKWWTDSDQFKSYNEAGKAFTKIVNSPRTGMGDVSAVYGFIKSLDPGTAVREGEVDFATSALGWLRQNQDNENVPDGVMRIFQKLNTGQLLTKRDRAELADAAHAGTASVRNEYDHTLGQHRATWQSNPRLAYEQNRIITAKEWLPKDENGNPLYKSKIMSGPDVEGVDDAEDGGGTSPPRKKEPKKRKGFEGVYDDFRKGLGL